MCCAKLHMVWSLGISIQAIFCVSHLSESLLSSCHSCDILIWAKLRAHQVVLFPPSHAVTFESCVFKSDCSILQLHRVQDELCFKKNVRIGASKILSAQFVSCQLRKLKEFGLVQVAFLRRHSVELYCGRWHGAALSIATVVTLSTSRNLNTPAVSSSRLISCRGKKWTRQSPISRNRCTTQ